MSDIKICCNCKSIYYKAHKQCNQCFGKTFQKTDEGNRPFIKWICTDGDNYQFARRIGETVYEFKEYDRFNGSAVNLVQATEDTFNWMRMTIDLNSYTREQQLDYIKPYYKSLEEVEGIYDEATSLIIAECIFEQESGLY